jgi:hypothetical protein
VKAIKGLQTSVSCFQLRSFVLQTLLLGVKSAFSLIVSFVFRFDCYEGCIVCVFLLMLVWFSFIPRR